MPTPTTGGLPLYPDNIPAELCALRQWVVWNLQTRKGRDTKVPFCARGGEADSTDAATWSTFGEAMAAYRRGGWAGVGFVFGPDDPFAGVDFDKCRDPGTGEIKAWAIGFLESLNSYSEVSPSGTGVKVIVRATHPGWGHNKRYPADADCPEGHAVEMYDAGRYFTITGDSLSNPPMPVMNRDGELLAIHREVFGPKPRPGRPPARPAAAPLPGDADLLAKARGGANGYKFSALYDGGAAGYGSGSEADLALCGMLAFWTGGDLARMDAMFRGSGLMREKWDERRGSMTYGERTLARAMVGRTEFYNPDSHAAAPERRPPPARRAKSAPGRGPVTAAAARPQAEIAAPTDDWEAPVPFGGADLPRFPMQTLPSPVREYVAEVAASRQVPEDMAAMMALTVVSAAGARRCEVRVGDTHTETLNLYCAVVMQPGSRKSGTLEDFALPLRDYERQHAQERFGAYLVEKERHKQQAMRLEALRTKIARMDDTLGRLEMQREAEELAAGQEEPAELPRLLADDITMERLAGLLAEQEDNCLTILSAEGGIFGIMAGRYANGAINLDLLLKGHGGETYRVDRVGQPPRYVDRPTVTLGLAVQPDVLQSLADNRSFRGQGLLGRFLYSIPPNMVGDRLYENRPVSPDARQAYCCLIDGLLRLPSLATKERPGLRHTLVIGGAALEVWRHYYDDVERKQAEGEMLAGVSDWASKLAGAVARIAGNLHLVRNAERVAPWALPVDERTVAAAWAIGEYLIPHALAAFSQIGSDSRHALALRLLRWMPRFARREGRTQFSARDCHRDMAKSASPEELTQALGALSERGYVRLQEAERTGATGRRPGPVYAIHPDLLKESDLKESEAPNPAGAHTAGAPKGGEAG